MCEATYERLYKLYRKNGMSEKKATYRARWFAENRQRIWNQGMVYARQMGLNGIAVPAGNKVAQVA